MENKPQEYDVLYYIKILNKLITNDFNNRLNEYGLTCQQGSALFFIYNQTSEGKEIHQNELEKRFNLSKSTVSGLVSRMEKNGLIIRENKKNYCCLLPSEKGKSIINNIHQNRIKTIDKICQGFNEKEKKKIMSIMQKMIENLKKEEELDV